MESPSYSVIVSVFNSANRLENIYSRLQKVLLKEGLQYELIFVDENSTDDSREILDELEDRDLRVKIIFDYGRVGQNSSTLAGVALAAGDYILTLQDDLNMPEDIPALISTLHNGGYDLVYGYYSERHKNLMRRYGSFLINRLLEKATGKELKELHYGSSFRIFTRGLARAVLMKENAAAYLDVSLLKNSMHTGYVPVRFNTTEKQASAYSLRTFVKTSWSIFQDSMVLKA